MNNDYALPSLRTACKDGSEYMTPLLKEVLDAHGGLTQWKQFTMISATIRSGADLWEMKGAPQDLNRQGWSSNPLATLSPHLWPQHDNRSSSVARQEFDRARASLHLGVLRNEPLFAF